VRDLLSEPLNLLGLRRDHRRLRRDRRRLFRDRRRLFRDHRVFGDEFGLQLGDAILRGQPPT